MENTQSFEIEKEPILCLDLKKGQGRQGCQGLAATLSQPRGADYVHHILESLAG